MRLCNTRVVAAIFYVASYFVILLVSQVILGLHRDLGFGGPASVSLLARPDEIIKVFGPSDFASYLKMAQMVPLQGFKTFRDIYSMFPPGLPLIEFAVLRVWPNAPVFAVLFGLALILWSVFFAQCRTLLARIFGLRPILAFVLPLALLLFPFFLTGLLWRAVGLTEAISSPLFAIALTGSYSILLYPTRESWRYAVGLGLLFAAAAFVRAQFDFTFAALASVSAVCLAGEWLACRSQVGGLRKLKHHALALLALVASYEAMTVPYKLYKHAPTIVVIDYVWANVWMTRADAVKQGDVFANAGMQSICEITPGKCQEFDRRRNAGEVISNAEYKKAGLSAGLHRPVRLLEYKLPFFWTAWFIDLFEGVPASGSYRLVTEWILLFSIPAAAVYAGFRRWQYGAVYALHAGALIGACVVFSIFIHIEPRYFLPIKLFGALSLILVMADALSIMLSTGIRDVGVRDTKQAIGVASKAAPG